MALIPTKLSNPCKVCGDDTGKCRQGREDADFVPCMTYPDSTKGEIVNGFKNIGTTKCGTWGLFKPDNSSQWTAEKAAERKSRKEQERQQNAKERAKKEETRRQRSLSAVERDKQYRALLAELTLHPDDRADLVRRGFSQEQIELSGFKSVERLQALRNRFSELLPGVATGGKKLVNLDSGYLCPLRDVDGLIVACQIRVRSLPIGEKNRYKWLSGGNPTLHLYTTGFNPKAELPLAVHRLTEKPVGIALVEGTGAKPFLTSQRLNALVIGAAGGQFLASESTLKNSLDKLSSKLEGIKEVTIYPDAGDIRNPQVMNRWERVSTVLRGWDWSVRFGWWGQIDKTDRDIDELDDYQGIQFLTTKEFLSRAEKAESSKSVKEQNAVDVNQSTTFDILNPPLTAPSPIQSLKGDTFRVLPIPESVASCLTTEAKAPRRQRKWFEACVERTLKVIRKIAKKHDAPRLGFNCYKEDKPELEESIRRSQRKLRTLSFKADIEINERYLPDELINQLPKSGLIGLNVHKGGGKSTSINKIIALAKEQGIPVLSITPRIALGREQATKWEITWVDEYGKTQKSGVNTVSQIEKIAGKIEKLEAELDELNRPTQRNIFTGSVAEDDSRKTDLLSEIEAHKKEIENVRISSYNALGLCWDSIWKVKDRNYTNGLVIIDEAELGLKHLITGSTCKYSRPKLIKTFGDIINDCLMMGGRVILSDADLSDLSINYIREQLPIPINPFIVKNEYIGAENTYFVDFRTGNRNCTIQEIIERVKGGQHLFITADSKKEARALEKLILKECEGFQRLFDDDNGLIDVDEKSALIIRLDSGTAGTATGTEIIEKPNEAILKWQPRVVIATPTLGVGVSIDEDTQRVVDSVAVPYFDAVVGLFFGVIEPSECRQQLSRVRANVPRIIWCLEGNHRIGGNASFFPEEINRHSMTYSQESLSILDIAKAIVGDDANDEQLTPVMMKLFEECWDKEGKVWNNPAIRLYAGLKAREHYGLWNLSNLLREELEDEGHRIIGINGSGSDWVEAISEIKEADRLAEAEAINLAPVIDPKLARKLKKRRSRTSEENRAVIKALLQEDLPGLVLDAAFIDKAVLKDGRRWLNGQRLFWEYKNPEAALDEDTSRWMWDLRNGAESGLFPPDIKTHSPKVKALRDSGLFEWIDLENPEKIYDGSSAEAKAFLSQALMSRDLIKVALGISVNSNSSPMKLAKLMLGRVGLSLKKVTKSKKDGRHTIDLELLNNPDRIRVLSSFNLKWTNRSNPVIAGAEVGGHQHFSYTQIGEVPPIISDESQCNSRVIEGEVGQNDVLTPAEELAEILTEYADSYEMFHALVEFQPSNVITAAIVAAPTPRCYALTCLTTPQLAG